MKLKWILLCFWITAIGASAYGQNKSRLADLGVPLAGATLNIVYNADAGPLQGQTNIKGIIYLFNNYKWAVDDLPLSYKNKSWEGKYLLPANCAFFAIKFVAEVNHQIVATDNNNDLGFLSTTVGKNNAKLPGGSLAWGTFRKPELNKAPQGYFKKANISDEALEMWVRKEMKDYPANVPVFFDVYLAMLKLSNPDEFRLLAKRNLQKLSALPNLTEQTYQIIYDSYNFLLKDQSTADSIKEVILQKFPKGRLQRLAAMAKANAILASTPGMGPAIDFLKDFSVNAYRKDSILTQNYIYYNFYRQLGTAYFANGKYDSLRLFIPQMDFQSLNEIYRWNITRAFLSKKVPLEDLYPIATVLIDSAISKRKDGSFMEETTYTPEQANYLAGLQLDQRLSLHIRILHKIQRDKEALAYLNKLSPEGRYSDADLNEARGAIYRNIGNEQLVKSALESGVRVNKATQVMLRQLNELYLKEKGDTVGFQSYISGLKGKDLVDKDKREVISSIVKDPFKSFVLKDLNGNSINTALLKDKIIVLDFWATWCYPCKMAFPGMQMLVDHYQTDQKVDFYFVSTMERKASYKEDINKYLNTSGFRFRVLLDDKNPVTGANDRVFKTMTPYFKSSAIPRKVVIKNGEIRYTSEGYNGSPSGLFDELSYVIEFLKAEK